jgi:hypothetical protein
MPPKAEVTSEHAGHDAAVQMIDTSVVRVHQHGDARQTGPSGKTKEGIPTRSHCAECSTFV